VYEAIRALEQVGVLSWVNRIKRVREYVPRPVRQPGATALRGAGSSAAIRPDHRLDMAGLSKWVEIVSEVPRVV